jgi:hypothetical protein
LYWYFCFNTISEFCFENVFCDCFGTFCVVVMKRFLVVRSGFFEKHGWVMKEATIFSWEDEATIFSWEDVPTRTRAGVVHGNEVRVYGVTTEAEIMIPVQAKPHLLEYMDLQMEALDEERLRNDLDAY